MRSYRTHWASARSLMTTDLAVGRMSDWQGGQRMSEGGRRDQDAAGPAPPRGSEDTRFTEQLRSIGLIEAEDPRLS